MHRSNFLTQKRFVQGASKPGRLHIWCKFLWGNAASKFCNEKIIIVVHHWIDQIQSQCYNTAQRTVQQTWYAKDKEVCKCTFMTTESKNWKFGTFFLSAWTLYVNQHLAVLLRQCCMKDFINVSHYNFFNILLLELKQYLGSSNSTATIKLK